MLPLPQSAQHAAKMAGSALALLLAVVLLVGLGKIVKHQVCHHVYHQRR
jgi:hypothetical protein